MDPQVIGRLLGFLAVGVLVPQMLGLLPRLVQKWRTLFYPTLIGGLLAGISFLIIGRIWLGLEIEAIDSQPGGYACGTFVEVMLWAILMGTATHAAVGFLVNLTARAISIRRAGQSIEGVQE
jgi:hypothetical protein